MKKSEWKVLEGSRTNQMLVEQQTWRGLLPRLAPTSRTEAVLSLSRTEEKGGEGFLGVEKMRY